MTADTSLTVERDHVVTDRPERTLYADTYRREGAENRPVVVFLYGGAWESGARGQFARWAMDAAGGTPASSRTESDDAAAEGFTAVELSYRLSDEATFPAQIRDVRAGLAWVREEAESFGGDPDRIAVVGHSAGAHLGLLASLAPEGKFGTASPSVDAAVGISGPYVYDTESESGDDVVERFLGGTPSEVPDRYEAAQPITHVSGDAPPTALLHGEDDEVVPTASARALAEAMEAAGDTVELRTYPGADHVFLHSSYWYSEVREDVFDFLRRSL
ncbi:alpha/beta hydrolase [Halopelagius inordinatus]|uniref:alpha/beta hydrolase n=1 Tax=Halopelagius inordinatus TaxID=553467 RepID=UPI000B865AFF|nr:alpha/beta hydrolase [Halopelagius inordinatus]